MIDLSIIIINYNTFELTVKCILSIYKYTSGVNFEIILVDNSSKECNPELFLQEFPNIKLIKNTENVGFAKGNNVGIEYARGNTILLLNSDTEMVDNAIGIAFNTLHNLNKSVGVITGKLMFANGDIQHNCGRFPSIRLQLIELLRIQKLLPRIMREKLLLGGFFSHNIPVYPDWVWGTFFMFKREVLNCFPSKKLSETFFMYTEDLEWCYIINKKWRIYFNPSVKLFHFASSSSMPSSNDDLNALIGANFKKLIYNNKGILWATFYFLLLRINRFIAARKEFY